MKYYVYKYVNNSEIIYIGKTDNIARRVAEHASGDGLESKFLPYLDSEIYYHVCSNKVEMDALERLLINEYKPILNQVDIVSGDATIDINVDWIYYSEYNEDTPTDVLEYAYRLCQRNILSNSTRIKHYNEESEMLKAQAKKLIPFYQYIDDHKDLLTRAIDEPMLIKSNCVPNEDSLYIGENFVECWHEHMEEIGDFTFVHLHPMCLKYLFEVIHRCDWIELTLDTLCYNKCRLNSEKATNLIRRNVELEAKKHALEVLLRGKNI